MKVKRFQQEANWGSARLAATYSRWMDQEVLALPSACSAELQCLIICRGCQVAQMQCVYFQKRYSFMLAAYNLALLDGLFKHVHKL